MQLNFPSNLSTAMSFKVGIAGTQTPPSNVSVVLEKNGKSMSYHASKVGDDWTAQIDQPGAIFGCGDVKVSVTVVINSRLFTPFKSIAVIEDVGGVEIPPVAAPEPVVVVAPPPPPPPPEVAPLPEPTAEFPSVNTTGAMPPPDSPWQIGTKVSDVIAPKEAAVPEQVVPEPVTPVVKPVETEEQKKKKVKDILAKAHEAVAKKKPEKAPTIRMGLLKTVEPVVAKKVTEAVEEVRTPARAVHPFSLKKTKVVFK